MKAQFAGNLVQALATVVRRFPVSLLFVSALTTHLSSQVAGPITTPHAADVTMGLSAAVFLSLAATLLAESRRVGTLWRLACALGVGVLAFATVRYGDIIQTMPPAFVVGCFACVFLAPYAGGGNDLAFWSYGRRLVLEIAVAGLAAIAVAAGAGIVAGSLSFLLDVPLPENIHTYISIFAVAFVAPVFVLSRFPTRSDDEAEADVAETRFFAALRTIADYVCAPVFLALALILHLYAGRIITGWSLPKGEIGWIVVSYGTGLLALLLAFEPFRLTARAPLRFLLRYWPVLLPVPLMMLGVAVYVRVSQYGFTPERYLLVAFGASLAVAMLLQFFGRTRRNMRLVAAVPVVALLVSSIGPTGAIGVSVASQVARFRELAHLSQRTLQQDAEARSALGFLRRHDALDRVAAPGMAQGGLTVASVAGAWGIGDASFVNRREPSRYSVSYVAQSLDSTGFDRVITAVSLYDGRKHRLDVVELGAMDIWLDGSDVVVARGELVRRLAVPRTWIVAALRSDARIAPVLDLTVDGATVRLAVSRMAGKLDPEPSLDKLSLALLIRSADWR